MSQDSGAPNADVSNLPDNLWTLRNKLIRIGTILSGISLAISLISVILAFIAFRASTETQALSLKQQRELKEIDLRQYCQKRYDELAYDAKFRVTNKDQATIYYRRFWDLQFEQYQYCKNGMIDQEIYATWIMARRLEWDTPEAVGGVDYRQGWTDMSTFFVKHDYAGRGDYKEFVDFMNGVFHGKTWTCVKQ